MSNNVILDDDPGDDQKYIVNACAIHAHFQQLEIDEEEKEAEQRMMIILRNGNNGEHYDSLNDSDIHPEF